MRLQFSDEINIALALRSMDAFERFGERPGADHGLAHGWVTEIRGGEGVKPLQRGPNGVFVYVVNPDSTVAVRTVQVPSGTNDTSSTVRCGWRPSVAHRDSRPTSVDVEFYAPARARYQWFWNLDLYARLDLPLPKKIIEISPKP